MAVGRIACWRAAILAAAMALATPAVAQTDDGAGSLVTGTLQSPILTVDSERLFNGSEFGRSVTREIEQEGTELAAENRRIEAELAAEERALTERRPDMEPEAFRAAADAFDARVMRIRREQDAKARALAQRGEAARRAFFEASQPVLQQIMIEAGAAVIVEQRSVFMSLDVIDITDIAIDRLDAAVAPEVPEIEAAEPPATEPAVEAPVPVEEPETPPGVPADPVQEP